MKLMTIACAATLGLATFAPEASAHGGQYRGPADVVPPGGPGGGGGPSGGGGGPRTPGGGGLPGVPGGGGGPGTGGGSGPGTGGPGGGGSGGGPISGGGMSIGEDLTKWIYWWEFNKAPMIQLRRAVHATGTATKSDRFYMGAGHIAEGEDTLRPTATQISNEILPRLKQALDATEQRDITSSCMIALAKIGEDHEQFKILDVFRERLTSKDLEIRQTAAISMGISQMTESVDDLIAIATDTQRGRELCNRREVDDFTRAFAAYGLGLVAHSTSNVDLKRQVFEALSPLLADFSSSRRHMHVSVINTISLLQPSDDPKGRKLLQDACDLLHGYWDRKAGPSDQLLQAHVPTAIAKLLDNSDDATLRAEFADEYVTTLLGRSKVKRSMDQITQSAALALGRLATDDDVKVSEALVRYFKKGRDRQTQNFCLIALGQIGGKENRDFLMKTVGTGKKAIDRPWAALGLGVYGFTRRDTDDAHSIGRALEKTLDVGNPETRAAVAIGLGLVGYQDAADRMRQMLEKESHQDQLAGYLAVGLALMGDSHSTELIQRIARASVRRPNRLLNTAVALGRLGDKEIATDLANMLTDGPQNLARMSAIAGALGQIGDRRTISTLVRMLQDESLTDLSRAFAAVALGGIADKEMLPWNSKIMEDINYRASVETLTNGATGVLDIL